MVPEWYVTDYFLSRRLISLMEGYLLPKGYVFLRWEIRGGEKVGPVFEYVFATPGGNQEVTTGISEFELQNSKHPMTTIAGVLSNRVTKKVEAANNPPPSPR